MMASLKKFLLKKAPPPPGPDRNFWTVLSEVVGDNPTPSPAKALAGIDELRTLCPVPEEYLFRLLRMLALHRSVVIQQKLLQSMPPVVQSGPFEGMKLSTSSKEGCYVPKWLGSYESALHPEWMNIMGRGYATIINIGCADGYYAVGLARRLPDARIFAYDLSAEARESCGELARLNDVAARIHIGGEFKGSDLEGFPDRNVLVICDIEGAERELLDPARYPRLHSMDILVEMHHLAEHHTDTLIKNRFGTSHSIREIAANFPSGSLPPLLADSDELDKLLAVWEWRVQPTPWALLLSKRNHPST